MNSRLIRSSAPGKLMLLGEHAVLHGHLALVAAVNRRLRVEIEPATGQRFRLLSGGCRLDGDVAAVKVAEPFTFVTAAIRRRRPTAGFELRLDSDLAGYSGLGSSAAVTVAVVAALRRWQGRSVAPLAVFKEALAVVREVQGVGSGADLAASALGGVLAYRSRPREIRQLPQRPPLFAVYSGQKADTAAVVAQVEVRRRRSPRVYARLYNCMEACVQAALAALRAEDWQDLGRLFNVQQGLLEAVGVSTEELSQLVYRLRADPGVFGAKLSGAGGGDCIVALGHLTQPCPPHTVLKLAVDPTGVTVDDGG